MRFSIKIFNLMSVLKIVILISNLMSSATSLADACPASDSKPDRLKISRTSGSWGYAAHLGSLKTADYQMMKDAGVGFVRFDMAWKYVETVPGQYDFENKSNLPNKFNYDGPIKTLLANHIRPIIILDYGNDLYKNGALTSPDWRLKFANFAKAAAQKYANTGIIWEIWNEPNAWFWIPYPSAKRITPNAVDYAALLHTAAQAIRSVDQGAAIIGPGMYQLNVDDWFSTFLKQSFSGQSILADIDAISVHPYRKGSIAFPESAIDDYKRLRAAIEANAPPCSRQIPIVSSEWGYSSASGEGISTDQQANYMVRSWLMNTALGVLPTIAYDWKNDGGSTVDPEQNYGAISLDGTPKPAYNLAKQIVSVLSGMTYSHRLPATNKYDWKLLFAGGGKVAVVSWNADPRRPLDPQQRPTVNVYNTPAATASISDQNIFKALQYSASIRYPPELLMVAPGHSIDARFRVLNLKSTNMTVSTGSSGNVIRTLAPGESFLITTTIDAGHSRSSNPIIRPVSIFLDGNDVTQLPAIEIGNFQALTLKESLWKNQMRVDILNPSGAEFKGTLEVNANAVSVTIPAGTLSQTVYLSSVPTGSYTMNLLDSSKASAVVSFGEMQEFSQFLNSAGVQDNFIERHSENGVTTSSKAQTSLTSDGPSSFALLLPYAFTKAPKSYEQVYSSTVQTIPYGVRAARFWMKGDGKATALYSRIIDSSGQIFQFYSMGNTGNTGWRLIELPLDDFYPDQENYFNSPADGVLHFPIRWDSLVIVNSPPGGNVSGSVQISRPIYISNGF